MENLTAEETNIEKIEAAEAIKKDAAKMTSIKDFLNNKIANHNAGITRLEKIKTDLGL